jgi:hypothetical protein
MRYGCGDPDNVLKWSQERYDEALMIIAAEGGYKIDKNEVERAVRVSEQLAKGQILNYPVGFFTSRTAGELLQEGFNEDQMPYINEELAKRGLTLRAAS